MNSFLKFEELFLQNVLMFCLLFKANDTHKEKYLGISYKEQKTMIIERHILKNFAIFMKYFT